MSTKVGPTQPATSPVKTAATQQPQTMRQVSAADLALLAAVKAAAAAPAPATTTAAAFTAAAPQQKTAPAILLPPDSTVLTPERLTRAVDTAIRSAAQEGVPLPSGSERHALYQLAQKMCGEGCKEAKEIEKALIAKLREKVDGPALPKSPSELDAVIDKAFKRVYENGQRATSAAELNQYRQLARDLAAQGMPSKDIMYAVSEKVREAKDYGGKPTEPHVQERIVDIAFQKVLEGAYRQPSRQEMAAWKAIASKLAEQGLSAKDIEIQLRTQLRVSLYNS